MHERSFIWIHIETNASCCLLQGIQVRFGLNKCICKKHYIMYKFCISNSFYRKLSALTHPRFLFVCLFFLFLTWLTTLTDQAVNSRNLKIKILILSTCRVLTASIVTKFVIDKLILSLGMINNRKWQWNCYIAGFRSLSIYDFIQKTYTW